MKIHLRQISSEGTHFEGEEDCAIPELERDEVRCSGPLRYNLDVGISEGALWASGSLVQPVELRCVRCLEHFPYEIQVPDFALHMPLSGPETIDLTPALREDILLNLPAHPHCDRDGGRVCQEEREPTTAEIEEKAKLEHDWGALDKLKLRNR